MHGQILSDVIESVLAKVDCEIIHQTTIPPQIGETATTTSVLPDQLAENLPMDSLYIHQARGLAKLDGSDNICVATPTASGKTLIYALHIAKEIRRHPDATALLIYPTKALSRDQQTELETLYDQLGVDIEIAVYDGDTGQEQKQASLRSADCIITNFAGLSAYLPHHQNWERVLSSLSTVVVDESHMYTGVLGIHAAWILRRLGRLAEHYGADPQYICSSATIANPDKHASQLIGDDVILIDTDGSPEGARDLYFVAPGHTHSQSGQSTENESAQKIASQILAGVAGENLQTLLFTDSRKLTEIDAMWAQQASKEKFNESINIESYNAGHRKVERRTVEDALNTGDLDAITTTSALEVGINVGSLDGVVLAGYPGSRQSFWQRLGRAGRSSGESFGVYVADTRQLDHYLLDNPSHVLDEPVERAVIDLSNNSIYAQHVQIAARELPLTDDDVEWFGPRLERAVGMYRRGGDFIGTLAGEGGVRYAGGGQPELSTDIYAAGKDSFEIVLRDGDLVWSLPNADASRAYRDYHPGAIYLHRGRRYEVVDFDESGRQTTLKRTDADYYTEVHRETVIEPKRVKEQIEFMDGVQLCYGTVSVKEYYPSYTRRDVITNESLGTFETDLSGPAPIRTDAMWVSLSDDSIASLPGPSSLGITTPDSISETGENDGQIFPGPYQSDMIAEGLAGVQSTLIDIAPSEVLVDRSDLQGAVSKNFTDSDRFSLIIHDVAPGGVGFSRRLFTDFETLTQKVHDRIQNCSCTNSGGCPSCVLHRGSVDEATHSKITAAAILELLCQ